MENVTVLHRDLAEGAVLGTGMTAGTAAGSGCAGACGCCSLCCRSEAAGAAVRHCQLGMEVPDEKGVSASSKSSVRGEE